MVWFGCRCILRGKLEAAEWEALCSGIQELLRRVRREKVTLKTFKPIGQCRRLITLKEYLQLASKALTGKPR